MSAAYENPYQRGSKPYMRWLPPVDKLMTETTILRDIAAGIAREERPSRDVLVSMGTGRRAKLTRRLQRHGYIVLTSKPYPWGYAGTTRTFARITRKGRRRLKRAKT